MKDCQVLPPQKMIVPETKGRGNSKPRATELQGVYKNAGQRRLLGGRKLWFIFVSDINRVSLFVCLFT